MNPVLDKYTASMPISAKAIMYGFCIMYACVSLYTPAQGFGIEHETFEVAALPSSTYEVIVIDDEDIVIESPTLILRAFEEDEPQDLSPKAPKPGSTHSGSSMWRV